jgi:ribosomal protein L19
VLGKRVHVHVHLGEAAGHEHVEGSLVGGRNDEDVDGEAVARLSFRDEEFNLGAQRALDMLGDAVSVIDVARSGASRRSLLPYARHALVSENDGNAIL